MSSNFALSNSRSCLISDSPFPEMKTKNERGLIALFLTHIPIFNSFVGLGMEMKEANLIWNGK